MAQLCSAFIADENGICVDTGEIKISEKKLFTQFVKTCTVLTFKIGKQNYLAHVDAFNPSMKEELKQSLTKIKLNKVKHVHVWRGWMCHDNCPSFEITKYALSFFNRNVKLTMHKTVEAQTIWS